MTLTVTTHGERTQLLHSSHRRDGTMTDPTSHQMYNNKIYISGSQLLTSSAFGRRFLCLTETAGCHPEHLNKLNSETVNSLDKS